jgi:hypothetical protein
MLSVLEFYQKYVKEARFACELLEVPETNVPVFLGWWDLESGREAGSWVGHNNLAGLTDGGPPNFLRFETAEDFVRAQVHALQVTWNGAAYAAVIKAMRDGRPPGVVALLVAQSPWDADHYTDSTTGDKLISRMDPYVGLWQGIAYVDDWKTRGRSWAVSLGITDGTRPTDPVTREEVWTMLQRYDSQKGEC